MRRHKSWYRTCGMPRCCIRSLLGRESSWILVKKFPWKSWIFYGFFPACFPKENGQKKSTKKSTAESKHQNPPKISGKGCNWKNACNNCVTDGAQTERSGDLKGFCGESWQAPSSEPFLKLLLGRWWDANAVANRMERVTPTLTPQIPAWFKSKKKTVSAPAGSGPIPKNQISFLRLSAYKMGVSMRLFKPQILSLFKLPFAILGEDRGLNDHLRAKFGLKWAVKLPNQNPELK